jgi:predicted transcriptional regulator
LYDQYGTDGVNAADQMGENGTSAPFGHGGGGGGGRPPGGMHFHHGGGGGGRGGMSEEDAQRFFSQFFGHEDPFGGFGMGGGRGGRGGAGPPMMFAGGMPGGMQMGGMPGGMHMGGMPGGMHGGGFPIGGGQPPRRPPVKRYDAIPPGTVASLTGLVSRDDRNGDRVEVVDYDPATGRYTVAVEDSDEMLKVKAANLLQHVHVTLAEIESQPSLNGQTGSIIAWDERKQRYSIYVMDAGRIVSLKPNNVILENGTVAKIDGLNAKPELNGKYGTVKAWVRESHRYEVQLSARQIVRIKVENVRV